MTEQPEAPMPFDGPAATPWSGGIPEHVTGPSGESDIHLGGAARVGWTLVPFMSAGLASWIPFVRYARFTRSRHDRLIAGCYVALSALLFALVIVGEHTSAVYGATGGLVILLGDAGAIHANVLYRRRVLRHRTVDPNTAALEAVRQARRRRAEARRILAADPAMARDLRVGRPDLPRDYDDGGLVDVNHVPARLLERLLGWSAQAAASVVEARQTIGGFGSAAELPAYTTVSQARVDAVSDLLVFARY